MASRDLGLVYITLLFILEQSSSQSFSGPQDEGSSFVSHGIEGGGYFPRVPGDFPSGGEGGGFPAVPKGLPSSGGLPSPGEFRPSGGDLGLNPENGFLPPASVLGTAVSWELVGPDEGIESVQNTGSGSQTEETAGYPLGTANGEDTLSAVVTETHNATEVNPIIKHPSSDESQANPENEAIHQTQDGESDPTVEGTPEDNFNYVGLYVTVGVFITFMVTLVAIALIRGPQGPFRKKRSESDPERVDGAQAEMVAVEGDGAETRTEAEWEQEPLQKQDGLTQNDVDTADHATALNTSPNTCQEESV